MSNIRSVYGGVTHLIEDGRAFVLSTTDLQNPSSAEVSKILLRNPIGSGKRMKVFKIEEMTTTSTGNVSFRYYRGSTVTSDGTPMAKVNLLSSGLLSVMEAFISPTVSVNGTHIYRTIIGVANTLTRQGEWLFILNEGDEIVINIRTNTAATFYNYNMWWVEV